MTALIALPLLILLVTKGSPYLFGCFIALVSFLGLTEFYRMALPDRKMEGLAASIAGAFLPMVCICRDTTVEWPLFFLTAFVLIAAIALLFRITEIRDSARDFALLLAGLLYVPLLLAHLLLLRIQPHGVQWLLLMMLIVMAGDTGAYYVGCSIGKRKLYPVVSPNKSVEGALGGLAGSLAGAVMARLTFFPELTFLHCLTAAMLLGVLGQIGDLFESMLKRSCGVKDSGVIIPGHGGILDRLDSILFAAPAAYYYAVFVFARL